MISRVSCSGGGGGGSDGGGGGGGGAWYSIDLTCFRGVIKVCI